MYSIHCCFNLRTVRYSGPPYIFICMLGIGVVCEELRQPDPRWDWYKGVHGAVERVSQDVASRKRQEQGPRAHSGLGLCLSQQPKIQSRAGTSNLHCWLGFTHLRDWPKITANGGKSVCCCQSDVTNRFLNSLILRWFSYDGRPYFISFVLLILQLETIYYLLYIGLFVIVVVG